MPDEQKNERAKARGAQIEVGGPADETSLASVFILPRQGRQDDFRMVPGQVLTVGEDITQDEANFLLSQTTWKFKEVK